MLHVSYELYHSSSLSPVCLFPFPLSLQYKKHRLSVGHTNNYAKSVVNMADMVRILLIVFLESLPQGIGAEQTLFWFLI